MRCEEKFFETYKKDPEAVVFCPYRVCPVGAHVDHQHGLVTGFAIDKGIYFAYGLKQNGVVEVSSLQFEKRAQFHILRVPERKQNDWADYLRGATLALTQKYTLSVGLCGVIEGTLPIGGLSSSAAVVIVYLTALCKVNNISISKEELIEISVVSENSYVGVSCGKLDQSCEVYSKKNHLLYLDTDNGKYELIPASKSIPPYKIAVFFSGIERSLAGSLYNTRVDECRSAAYALMAYAGMEYGKFNETYFRNVPFDIYETYKSKLPKSWCKRAEHWYTEQERVKEAVEAWRQGNIEKFGKLSFKSGQSSIDNWESGSEELKTIYEIMKDTDGIYGGRFSGAGFKGCCMALIDPSYENSISEKVSTKYLERFPQYKGLYASFFCSTTDGIN